MTHSTSYQVYRSTGAKGAIFNIGSPTTTAFDDKTATPGVGYYYWVKACNSTRCSDYSSYDHGNR